MGGSTKCCLIVDRLCGSDARLRHPTCKESTDAASETHDPQTRKGIRGCLPGATWCSDALKLGVRVVLSFGSNDSCKGIPQLMGGITLRRQSVGILCGIGIHHLDSDCNTKNTKIDFLSSGN